MIHLLTNYANEEHSKLESIVEASLDAGFDCIQFSWNRDDALFRLENVKKLISKYNATLCVNNNLELAKKFEADYIHIGPNDVSIEKIKKELPDIKVGFSIHPHYMVGQLELNVDYLGIGPVYPTITYKGHNLTFGENKFKDIVKSVNTPVCAIGGINLDNIKTIKESNCKSICVAGAVYRANDPYKAASRLVKFWNAGK